MDVSCAIASSRLPSGSSIPKSIAAQRVAVNERRQFCTRLDSLRPRLADVFQQPPPGFFALRPRNSVSDV